MFRGALRVLRIYEVASAPKMRQGRPPEEGAGPPTQQDIICDVDLEIPKVEATAVTACSHS